MSDSVSLLEQIDGSQAAHEVTANALFDAGSVSTAYGRHAEACAGLTWGYYGARYGGNAIANGTNACGASTTTYQVTHLTTGAVSFSTATTNWNSTTYGRDYLIVSGASTITSYQDHRFGPRGVFTAAGVAGSGDALVANPLSQFAATTSAQLASVISDESGSGALVFAGSPALTGTPTAPTAAAATNTTQLATTEFVRTEVANLIASSPAALDTLDELAAALGDDANFASTITSALALKAPLASPALTGTPTVPTAAPGTNTTQAASTAFVAAAVASGDVATDVIWDAAGDMVQGTGANTAARTAIGTVGQVWTVNAGATAGAWTSPPVTSPAFSATPTLDTTSAEVIYFGALTANVTAFNLSGTRPKVVVCFVQDGTGSRTVTAGTSLDFGSEITDLSGIRATASTYTYVGFVYNPTTTKFRVVAISK